jgi:uncharacterized protein YjiS (DUF1127 family)
MQTMTIPFDKSSLKEIPMSKTACVSSDIRAVGLRAPWPARALAAALRRIARPWRRAAAIRDLSRLDDRLLRDMGIERHAIDEAVDTLLETERPRE